MPIETFQDHIDDLTVHKVIGPPILAEMRDALEISSKQKPTMKVIWDMSQADVSNVTAEMLQMHIERAAKLGVNRRGGKTAIVAASDLQFGLGRMSEAFADIQAAPYEVRAFRSREEAMCWLAEDHRSPL